MFVLAQVLLSLTLLLCGCYAGFAVFCQIGVMPAMRRLPLASYADAFRAMDHFLDRSMPPYKLTLLLVNLSLGVVALLLHRRHLAAAVLLAFFCNIAALVLTVRKQLPLNTRLKQLPGDVSDVVLLDLREQTIRNFMERCVVSVLAFAVLCVGAVVWPLR